MPLLMCPNDNAQMQTLDRNGVQFDMCPSCRGVWLDRGELEKLMESAAANAVASAPPAQAYAPPPQQSQPWGQVPQQPQHRDPYREQPRYRDDDDHRYKKKKRDSIFDIFD